MTKERDATPPVEIRYESEEVPAFYANVAQLATTPYDVIATFGRRKAQRDEDGALIIADAIQVYMSPQHAKSIARLIDKQLAIYEKLYGPIPSDTPKSEVADDQDVD